LSRFKVSYFDVDGDEFTETYTADDAAAALGMLIDDEDIEFASDAPFIVELVATRKRKKKKSSKGRRKLKTVPIDNRIEVLAFKNLPKDVQKTLLELGCEVGT